MTNEIALLGCLYWWTLVIGGRAEMYFEFIILLLSSAYAHISIEAVQRNLLPNDPRAQAMIELLTRVSALPAPRLLFSTASFSDRLDKVLQFYVSKLDHSDGGLVTGATPLFSPHPNIAHVDNDRLDAFLESFPGRIDLLFISNNGRRKNEPQLAQLLLEGVKRISKRGFLLFDECQSNGCEMLEHFAKAAGFIPALNTLGSTLVVLKRALDVSDFVEDLPFVGLDSINNVSDHGRPAMSNDEIESMLSQGNVNAIFANLLPQSSKHFASLAKVAKLARERGGKIFVKTGRHEQVVHGNDDTFVLILARLAKLIGGQLNLLNSQGVSDASLQPYIQTHKTSPAVFFAEFKGQIDLLYLQSDHEFDGINNGPSQMTMLAEIKAAQPHLHSQSIVLMDDCGLAFGGNCKAATHHLLVNGWDLIFDGYQRVFVKNPTAINQSSSPPPPPSLAPSRPQTQPARLSPQQPRPKPPPPPIRHPPPPLNPVSDVMASLREGTIDAIFSGLIDQHSGRYVSFRRVADLAVLRGARTMVETGTARGGTANCGGDGCSTAILGRLAILLSGHLHTVDISSDNIEASKRGTQDLASHIDYHVSDSVAFLKAFNKRIDVLYLDSYDYDGIEYGPSQQHHLKELMAAWDKIHDLTIIFLDDCSLAYEGKCKMASEYLSKHGWQLEIDAYQRVYIKSGTESLNNKSK